MPAHEQISPGLRLCFPAIKTELVSTDLAVWAQGSTPESMKCYYWIVIMELLRWDCNRWDFFIVHPWFSGLAQHRWSEPRPQKKKLFILNSVFLVVKKDRQKAVWGVLSLPPFPITLLKQKGSQLGDFPAATATISQQPRVKTKRWHKGLCSSFIPQLSACLCHPPCSPPPIKPFT